MRTECLRGARHLGMAQHSGRVSEQTEILAPWAFRAREETASERINSKL